MKDVKSQIIGYLKETRAEFKKVSWPERKYVTSATLIILLVVFVIAVITNTIDWGLAKAMLYLTKAF